jgi:hypothetical protein
MMISKRGAVAALAPALVLAGMITTVRLPAAPAQTSPPFRPGEKLTYSVTWSVFEAGEVSALLEESGSGADDYQIVTTAQSHGIVSTLYKLDDEYRSRFNPQTVCSEGISKHVVEGRRRKQTEIVFDSSRKLAILDERNSAKSSEPPKHDEHPIPSCVEDVVSAFYYLRTQPMHVGDRIQVPVNDGSKTTLVTAEVQAREEIDTPLGRRFALRVEPAVFGPGSVYQRKGRMLIWFSDDAQRLPLRIKAMLSVGTLTGTLVSVSGNATIGSPPAAPPITREGNLPPLDSADPPAAKSPNLN